MFSSTRCLAVLLFLPVCAGAEIKVPSIFTDHMVVQREKPIPVWGWGDPGETVSVRLGGGAAVETRADDQGNWKVELPAMPAGGPHQLDIKGGNTLVVKDVLVGEVWVCSGQSNMQWTVAQSGQAKEEIAAANHPRIRHIAYPRTPAGRPVQDQPTAWKVCGPETVAEFTAVGYYFARHLHGELDVPVGLINASWGGTRIEPWIPPVGLERVPKLADIARDAALATPGTEAHRKGVAGFLQGLDTWSAATRQSVESGQDITAPPAFPNGLLPLHKRDKPQQQPTTLFNGMISPFIGYGIRGALWYQGESNHNEGMLYRDKKQALVDGWRKLWGQGEFPFYFVQIAPYHYNNEDPSILPAFWEAQAACLSIPNTGMAVIHDVGNPKDIHPTNKQEVGRRLALIALARDYGKKETVYSGPTFKEMKIDGAKVVVTFANTGGGLVTRDGKPVSHFELLAEQGGFVPAEAVIEGATVVVSSPGVTKPKAVRFAWHKLAEPNLANQAGLPAAAFRAGDHASADPLTLHVPEAGEFLLAYDLDLSKLGPNPSYTSMPHADITRRKAKRVAYFLELQRENAPVQYLWVALDAFTPEVGKLAVPTLESGAAFQSRVGNLMVRTNAPGLTNGPIESGNIEFWPNNYGPGNTAKVPGASGELHDHGDGMSEPRDGYGSMQIHDTAKGQTLFAINHWKAGRDADIGIGNSTGKTRDWTFSKSASGYRHQRLRVFVQLE